MIARGWKLASLALVPVFIILIAILQILNIANSFNPPILLLIFDIVFLGFIPLYVSYIASRSFRNSGAIGVLLCGAGMLMLGLSSVAVGIFNFSPISLIFTATVKNVNFSIGAFLQLVGILTALAGTVPRSGFNNKWISRLMYGGCFLFFILFSVGTITGVVPPFFSAVSGHTSQWLLFVISAIEFFALASGILFFLYIRRQEDFFFWYSIGLALIAIGFVAASINLVPGSQLSWVGRAAEYTGAMYILFAFVVLNRTAQKTGLSLEDMLSRFFSEPEQYFRAIVETAGEGIVLERPDGKYTFVNQQFADMLGYQRGEILGKSGLDLTVKDLNPDVSQIRTKLSKGEIVSGEFKFRRKDGSALWSAYNFSPIYNERGEQVANIGFHTDITERKQAEEELSKRNEELNALNEELTASQEELRLANDELIQTQHKILQTAEERQLALDAANLGWWYYDPVTRISRYDERYREIFGVAGEMMPNDEILATRIHPDDLPGLWAKVESSLDPKDPKTYSAEYRINLPGGIIKWIEAHGVVTFEGSGDARKATKFVGTVRDITEQKEAEAALHDNIRLLEDVMNGSTSPIFLKDLEGKFMSINSALERTFGMSQAELKGKTDYDIAPKDLADYWRSHDKKVVETGKAIQIEEVADLPDGHHIFLANKFPLVNTEGRIYGVGAISHDITDRKLAEEALLQKNIKLNLLVEELTATEEKLRHANEELSFREKALSQTLEEKEVLLSEIHHRVKNNLTAFISLLSLKGSTEDTAAGAMLKQDLQNRARSMALIHETLYRTSNYDKVDMKNYLGTLVNQIAQTFNNARPVQIDLDAQDVFMDLPRATPLGLIVNELVTNSFKYAFPESFDVQKIRGNLPTIALKFRKDDGYYTLLYKDNGVGLPPDIDIRNSKSLGLKLVNFLAGHQLHATVEVNLESGTEFIFRFKESER